jgi:hypothetical protein
MSSPSEELVIPPPSRNSADAHFLSISGKEDDDFHSPPIRRGAVSAAHNPSYPASLCVAARRRVQFDGTFIPNV